MIYIFDTNCFIVLGNYFPNRFPSVWRDINSYIDNGKIISVREVYNEIQRYGGTSVIKDWADKRSTIFLQPCDEELEFVRSIYSITHFRNNIRRKTILHGYPVADPFIIASAAVKDESRVVTQETFDEGAAKIPNICSHFNIGCINLEMFMEMEGLQY